ncbi:MAG: DUF2202 domain-containing protein [Helicobacteraceae bacterium]|nr:DUF2202 domain-containing protein [Candidatus Sulfurimonas ponti]
MKKSQLFLLITLQVFFIGCSGGGGGSSTTTSSAAVSGQLIDSYLQNITYICPDSSEGVTDINGSFSCKAAPITFKLGGLTLGTISSLPADKHIFPQDLLHVDRNDTNNTNVKALANFLQSCDDDQNASNGINIPDALKNALSGYSEDFNTTRISDYILDTGLTLLDINTTSQHLNESYNDFVQISEASQVLLNTLSHMGNEERLAYDVYNYLYDLYPNANVFNNISQSENEHINAVQTLVQKYITDYTQFTNVDLPENGYKDTPIEEMEAGKYDISKIQDLYNILTAKGASSEVEALEVGCMIEVVDIIDLTENIAIADAANAKDIVNTFTSLRNGSYNHYWAFDNVLINKGVTEGCCSVADFDGISFCHPEYPKE